MTEKTRHGLAAIGLMTLGITTMVTSGVAKAAVKVMGDSATISYPTNDLDMVIFDTHPDVKTIVIGPSEPWSGPGPIPPFLITDAGFAHIANCKKLETLTISSIHPLRLSADGYKALAGLTQLRVLGLGRISDAGLAHLSGLTNLEELGLGWRADVHDESMQVLGKFKKLRMLDLYGAPITDAGVAHLKDLVELQNLQLGETLLGDEALRTVGTFTKLTTLDVRSPNVTDAGLMHLKNLRLHWLAASSEKVTGSGLAALSDMTDIEYLWLDGTRIDDASLDHLAGLKKLRHFGICKTRVTDAGLAKLIGLEQIESLKLDDLPLTDAAIPTLKAMHSLKDVQMNWTRVTDAGLKQLEDAGIKRGNIFRR